MSELLSISIPTRNRAPYLQGLLNSIEEQVGQNRELLNDIKIYIFDNASNDSTCDVVKSSGLDILYKKNDENIGVDLNILQAYTAIPGKYVWVIGDDEILMKNSLNFVLGLIKGYNPHLINCRTSNYETFTEPWVFPDYLDFLHHAVRLDPWCIIGHSLISCNVLLKDCFDAELAIQKKTTNYGQFYGMVRGLKNLPGVILYPSQVVINLRTSRAPCVDGITPNREAFNQYAEWVTKEFELPPDAHGNFMMLGKLLYP
jgi:glycosyltransferase involved in cell wall biosynthesis